MKPMNTPRADSLPLDVTLALADFDAHARRFRQRLVTKLERLHTLEQTDFVSEPAAFRQYAALRRDTEATIDFLQLTEQTLQTLCDRVACGPLRLRHYHRLWVENQQLRSQLQAVQQQVDLLDRVNDLLTDLLLNHYETNSHATNAHATNPHAQNQLPR